MLQFLTGDLMPGYGLPKKRVSVNLWSLLDSVISHENVVCTPVFQRSDVVALGRPVESCLVYALYADSTVKAIAVGNYRSLDYDDLHHYLY
jgi:hypothetical protein